jgi:arylamine N-acetyltransferase
MSICISKYYSNYKRVTGLNYPTSTEEHFMDVRPQALFDSMVLQRHGSYCFGQNTLLLGMLRALGFRSVLMPICRYFSHLIFRTNHRCYSGCARVNGERLSTLPLQLSTITHMILFVNPSDSQSTYLIDVAFGARCLARPIKVEAGEMVKGSAAPEEHRLIRLAHPNSAIEAEDWALQMRCGSMIPDWVVQYQFSINEFFPEDHEALSFALCKRPNRTFGVDILAVKCFHVEGEGNDGRIGDLGRLSLALGRVKRVIGDQSSIIRECSTELERIQALRELFGIDIHDSDATHVKDQPFALLN